MSQQATSLLAHAGCGVAIGRVWVYPAYLTEHIVFAHHAAFFSVQDVRVSVLSMQYIGVLEKEGCHGCRVALAAAVRAHGYRALPVRSHVDWHWPGHGHRPDARQAKWARRRPGHSSILDQGLHHHVCRWRGDGYHHGVFLRHQLGQLLALRGRYLRRTARSRGAARVLPGKHVSGRAHLRAWQGV